MKIHFFTYIILFWSVCAESNDFKENWKLIRDNEASFVWQSIQTKTTFGSVSIKEKEKNNISLLFQNKTFLENLINKRKKMLSFSGVSEWQMDKHHWLRSKNNKEAILFIEGTYKDHQSSLISFYEVHKYTDKQTIQVLYTQKEGPKLDLILSRQLLEHYGIQI